jgi:hypothetical protein
MQVHFDKRTCTSPDSSGDSMGIEHEIAIERVEGTRGRYRRRHFRFRGLFDSGTADLGLGSHSIWVPDP